MVDSIYIPMGITIYMEKEIIVKGGKEDMGMQPITITKYTCERCGHSWLPRKMTMPEICPKCNSALWHTPRTENLKNE